MINKTLFLILIAVIFTGCQTQPQTIQAPLSEPTITQEQTVQEFEFTALEENISAFDLTQQSATVEAQEYEFGTFITSINGVVPPEGSFWALYLNNEKAQTGASELILKAGDVITWKIESIQ